MSGATIRESVQAKPLVRAKPNDSVRQAARLMGEHCCGSVAVMDGGQLLGLFTESDLVARVVAKGFSPDDTRLDSVMTRDPAQIFWSDSVAHAIRTMHECGFQHLPVMEDGKAVAMISWRDLPMDQLSDLQGELSTRQSLMEHIR